MSFKLITIANVVTAVCDCITSRERMLQCCMIRVKVHFVRALIDRCATYCSPLIMMTTSSATFLACLKPCLCVDCSLHLFFWHNFLYRFKHTQVQVNASIHSWPAVGLKRLNFVFHSLPGWLRTSPRVNRSKSSIISINSFLIKEFVVRGIFC